MKASKLSFYEYQELLESCKYKGFPPVQDALLNALWAELKQTGKPCLNWKKYIIDNGRTWLDFGGFRTVIDRDDVLMFKAMCLGSFNLHRWGQ